MLRPYQRIPQSIPPHPLARRKRSILHLTKIAPVSLAHPLRLHDQNSPLRSRRDGLAALDPRLWTSSLMLILHTVHRSQRSHSVERMVAFLWASGKTQATLHRRRPHATRRRRSGSAPMIPSGRRLRITILHHLLHSRVRLALARHSGCLYLAMRICPALTGRACLTLVSDRSLWSSTTS